MKKLYGFLIFFIFLSQSILAQNCVITTATNKVCLGNTLLFNVSFDAGLTATSYTWNFGNGGSSSQSSPIYQYPLIGSFTPSVTITFSNSTNCTVNGQVINVVALPNANFVVSSEDTQCFKNNNFCITDLSSPGTSLSALQSRIVLWGDGSFNNSAPAVNPVCYSYSNPLGGAFPIVVEVTDGNGCVARKEIQKAVVVWPKMQEVSFSTNYTIQCNQTPVTFTNTSKIPQSMVQSYVWDFGDGTTSNSPWNNFIHTYTKSGTFTAKLIVKDVFGCSDTFVLPNAGANAKINDTLYLDQNSSCYRNNRINMTSGNVQEAVVSWAVFNAAGVQIDTIVYKYHSVVFPDCGRYKISMYVTLGTCKTKTDTFVDIYGPNAVAETPQERIINSIQCEIHDTVIFRTPVMETSCYHKNTNMFYIWDFGDQFAPPCTTDTRNNINVGINCRYSKDTLNVKHRYYNTKEQCYEASLIMTDLVRGCTDTSKVALKLTQPDAGWDSTSTPIRRGLYYKINTPAPCLDNPIEFKLDETLPLCGLELAWINVDSACGKNQWLQIDTFANSYTHVYNATCNPSGWVTVGLIIKNGKDKNGAPCYDTAWYHYMFRLLPINPNFIATNLTPGCGPWRVKVALTDSIQDSIVRMDISFNQDTSIVYYVPLGDSILPSYSYTFKTAGIKRITVTLTNTRGCVKTTQQTLFFGFSKSFTINKNIVCLGDSVQLLDNIKYHNSLYQYWRDTARINAGKERIIWDVGDGTGFSKFGPKLFVNYARIANFPVRMIAIDSLGCADTIKTPQIVKVIGVDAKIAPMLPRYLCSPQILNFTDNSVYSDSSSLYAQLPYDKIVIWKWDFDDGKPGSLIKNPVHDFTTNGVFNTKLYVETNYGCKDSDYVSIFIDGPKPKFNILGDTIGCAPFTVKLNNTTGYQLQNWIWFFRDQNGNTLSTLKDTGVTFTYTKGGIYKIYLVGEDTIFNHTTMQYKTCQAVFPDSFNINAPIRQVMVIDRVGATIAGPDSVCLHAPFTLTAKSTQLFAGYKWFYGDGDSTIKLWPDTFVSHAYSQINTYKIRLIPQGGPAGLCIDTAEKLIKVSSIMADFDLDESKAPVVSFTNKSNFAVRYEWNFGHPSSGGNNFSTETNPIHNYGSDTGVFTICLKAFNIDDCYDSICKETTPKVKLVVPNVFTPNKDGFNDAYDIDIQGYTKYELVIYNRWGNKVYDGKADGIGNDGNNWNGRNFNTGSECPEGVYYFVFKYRLITMSQDGEMHGTITLIRD